jgi:ABC-type transport system involved in multi-copper enzyme maturation permease subunit
MIWAAWRVQRSQIVAAVGVVLVFALWLLISGIATGHNPTFKYWTDADVYVLFALPGVLGLALGAPLIAGESSLGTNRLAWTQSVTRNRWLAFKFLVGAVVTAGIVIALGFLLDWWTGAVSVSALTNSGGFSSAVRIQPTAFVLSGIVAIGYALFAFSLGVALGAVIRRPGWAFALGIPIFAAARIVVQGSLRAHLVAPAIFTNLAGLSNSTLAVDRGWVLHSALLPANRLSPPPGRSWAWSDYTKSYDACRGAPNLTNGDEAHCAAMSHLHFVFQYQPDSHYWALQGIETAIFLGLGLLLLGLTVMKLKNWRT